MSDLSLKVDAKQVYDAYDYAMQVKREELEAQVRDSLQELLDRFCEELLDAARAGEKEAVLELDDSIYGDYLTELVNLFEDNGYDIDDYERFDGSLAITVLTSRSND